MMTPPRLVFACNVDGPSLIDDQTGDEHQISCNRQRGHTLQHEWWNDDGSVRVTWWDDYVLGDGRWRDAANAYD